MAKTVRMSDIAKRLGVSTVSVSKGLAGKDGVSEELRARILAAAQEMGFPLRQRYDTLVNGKKAAVYLLEVGPAL